MADRNTRLQKELDDIEKGWVVVKPVAPADDDSVCVFQKAAERKEARASIPRRWFDDREDDRISQAVRAAVSDAKVRF